MTPRRMLLPLLLLSIAAAAEVREVPDFDRVTVALPGTLVIERGDDHRVDVDAAPEDLERIETQVSGGALELRWRGGFWNQSPAGAIRVRVVLPELTGVTLQGSGKVEAGRWRCDELTLALNGSGDLRFDELIARDVTLGVSGSGGVAVGRLDAAMLRLQLSGSGNVSLAGRAPTQTIEVSGSGDVDAADLEGIDVSVDMLGSGHVRVWARGSLEATLRGSGDIRYRGEPVLERTVTGSGELRPL